EFVSAVDGRARTNPWPDRPLTGRPHLTVGTTPGFRRCGDRLGSSGGPVRRAAPTGTVLERPGAPARGRLERTGARAIRTRSRTVRARGRVHGRAARRCRSSWTWFRSGGRARDARGTAERGGARSARVGPSARQPGGRSVARRAHEP